VRGVSVYSGKTAAPAGHPWPKTVEEVGPRHRTFGGGMLRAGVFDVNDGLVSNTCLVMGVEVFGRHRCYQNSSPSLAAGQSRLPVLVRRTALGEGMSRAKLGPVALPAFGSGSGLHGMPGDFTAPLALRARGDLQPVCGAERDRGGRRALSLPHLNQFDIPKGSVQNLAIGGTVDEITEWTSVADLKNLR
jgi:hypothetical protein